MTKIKSIKSELADCRAAFATYPNAFWAWCCHHENHCELLVESAEMRIQYILSDKSKPEQARRFRNFRPCKDDAAVKTARDAYDEAVKPARDALCKLHKKEWPNNSWNGKSIFD